MIFENKEISNAKVLILKTIFLSVGSELIKKHLIQEEREFFGIDWTYKLIAAAAGWCVYSLITYKVSERNKEKRSDFHQVIFTDFIKLSTTNIVKAFILSLLLTNKEFSDYPITKSIIFSIFGSIIYELISFDFKSSESELEQIKNTEYYKSTQNYFKTLKTTIKKLIITMSSDIFPDGDMDTDGLITIFIQILTLPFYLLNIEPNLKTIVKCEDADE